MPKWIPFNSLTLRTECGQGYGQRLSGILLDPNLLQNGRN